MTSMNQGGFEEAEGGAGCGRTFGLLASLLVLGMPIDVAAQGQIGVKAGTFIAKGKEYPLPAGYESAVESSCREETVNKISRIGYSKALCIAEVVIGDSVFVAVANKDRTNDHPGFYRIIYYGEGVVDLGSISSDGNVHIAYAKNGDVQFLVARRTNDVELKSGQSPYAIYAVTRSKGRPSGLKLIDPGPRVKGQTMLEKDQAWVARQVKTAPPQLAGGSAVQSQEARRVPTGRGNVSSSRYESKEEIACRFAVWTGVSPNITDLFDCDQAKAIASLREGRRFNLLIGNISYSNGKIAVWTRQFPSRAEYLQQKLRERGGPNYWAYFSDRSSMEWYDITCIFPENAASKLKKGETIIVSGKLRTANGTYLTLDCT